MEKITLLGIIFATGLPIIRCRGLNYYNKIECGPYGFVCDGVSKLRLCEEGNVLGPGFKCPANTICNEDSLDVCENAINYIDPLLTRNIRCYRNERLADPSVPGCKGYIMCIPNKNRFQGLKFQCSGSTIFNGYTRACTSPDKYVCPLGNGTSTQNKFSSSIDKGDKNRNYANGGLGYELPKMPIECENYKFIVTTDDKPNRVTYFCPRRPLNGESSIRCTVFSNKFCLSLERDEEDQFLQSTGSAYRRPRNND